MTSWGGWTRTINRPIQSRVPYRLATPQWDANTVSPDSMRSESGQQRVGQPSTNPRISLGISRVTPEIAGDRFQSSRGHSGLNRPAQRVTKTDGAAAGHPHAILRRLAWRSGRLLLLVSPYAICSREQPLGIPAERGVEAGYFLDREGGRRKPLRARLYRPRLVPALTFSGGLL